MIVYAREYHEINVNSLESLSGIIIRRVLFEFLYSGGYIQVDITNVGFAKKVAN